jgi:hypothetical protein
MTLRLSHKKSEKCEFKNYAIIMSKLKLKIGHHQMRNLRVKCIEHFQYKKLLLFFKMGDYVYIHKLICLESHCHNEEKNHFGYLLLVVDLGHVNIIYQ